MTGNKALDELVGGNYSLASHEGKVFKAVDATLKDGKFYLTLREIAKYVKVGDKTHIQKSIGPDVEAFGSDCFQHGPVQYGPVRSSL